MSKEHIVPIQEAATERIIAKNLQLPPYLNGRIGIDLEKTIRLMNIGGISHVFLENREEDEQSVPQIVGFDAQGTAYSGFAKSKTRNASELDTRDWRGFNTKGAEWRAMRIALDIKVITEGIMQKEDGSLHSAEAWIRPLNREVRNNIRKEGVAFSLKPSRFVLDYGLDTGTIYTAEELVRLTLSREFGAEYVFAAIAVLASQGIKLINMTKPDYRADLLFSTHIGRVLWATFRANTAYRNLIVAMDKRNQD